MLTTGSQNDRTPPIRHAAIEDSRSEPRYPFEFSIEVSGFDHAGRFFTEGTHTVDASFCGCRFHLRTPVERGAVIAIRMLKPRSKPESNRATLLFRVAHVAQEKGGWSVGVWKLQSSNAWSAEFADAIKSTNVDS